LVFFIIFSLISLLRRECNRAF
jgi:hypothetical protein